MDPAFKSSTSFARRRTALTAGRVASWWREPTAISMPPVTPVEPELVRYMYIRDAEPSFGSLHPPAHTGWFSISVPQPAADLPPTLSQPRMAVSMGSVMERRASFCSTTRQLLEL